ncbi:PspA/IM30 family protein [Paenibacillus thermotolerans]|uniref:PspA/IM30 family protein n=1 Tax=Paenibacillus thermotolerans TaxID=3027807 RepID=UPI002368A45C|nr:MULTISPECIES: PspA/IM30 family protein [unclassified Paenibacillus]
MAKDPVKEIDDFIRRLQENVGKVRAETAAFEADERRARTALDECRAEIRKLRLYAEKAAADGCEENARTFLEKKAALNEKESQLQAAYGAAAANAERMRQIRDRLSTDADRLEARRAAMKGKLAAAKARETLHSLDSSLNEAKDEIDRVYEEAMALFELRAEAKNGLNASGKR